MENNNTAIIQKMTELNKTLKHAADVYYNDDTTIMSDYEYDALYDELTKLEKETGIILSDSITQKVGFDVQSELPKEHHTKRMLSLEKTKSVHDLIDWLGDKVGCLSWKLDGSTLVLTYENGKLVKAITRGNGEIGELITPAARHIYGIPQQISYLGSLIVRGEAVMSYAEFKRVNETIEDLSQRYKNPRNLANGTLRSLDTSVLGQRRIDFLAFTLVSGGIDTNSYTEQLDWLSSQGFSVVEHVKIESENIESEIKKFEDNITSNVYPSDGLVLFFDDVSYGLSLGETTHAPRNGIAFKWQDETQETIIRDIIWSPSRTGRLTPVAIFDPVELEGTTVERASLHNINYVKDMKINIGDHVMVYKANMIIPQIAENITRSLTDINDILPKVCPSCGGDTLDIVVNGETETLVCKNPLCNQANIRAIEHFASRVALNINGLSSGLISSLADNGILNGIEDIFKINEKRNEIVGVLEGWKDKRYDNLMESIENARHTTIVRFLVGLGIPEVGRSNALNIVRYYNHDFNAIIGANLEDMLNIEGVGGIIGENFVKYMEGNREFVEKIASYLTFEDAKTVNNTNSINEDTGEGNNTMENPFDGKTFAITGSLEHYSNRNILKEQLEEAGAKVAGSVSKNTDYLITNTPDSGSSKNKKAKECGTAIITEQELFDMDVSYALKGDR